MHTPWGESQYHEEVAPGIMRVETEGHGGLHVSAALLEQTPRSFRLTGGWYEEDAAWALVALAFPQHFTEPQRERALRTANNWYPDRLIAAGYDTDADASYVLRQRAFSEANKQNFVVRSAWGDWQTNVPKGQVLVSAIRAADAAEKYFLVPGAEYDDQRAHAFVINEARHTSVRPEAYGLAPLATKSLNRLSL